MKLYSKLSALGAVLVLSTAFASADTVTLASGSGGNYYGGYSTTVGGWANTPGFNNQTGTSAVYTLNGVTPIWTAAQAGSTWISYDPNSGPSGGEGTSASPYDLNGYYIYGTQFTTTGGTYIEGSLTVLADDTAAVYLNGVNILPFGNIGSDDHCADGTPNCISSETITFDSSTPGFNNDGTNNLSFVVDQAGSLYQGLDYSGYTSTTPEPNTLLLLGTGLIGSAGALFRRMRTSSN